jgi:hypothetical protein
MSTIQSEHFTKALFTVLDETFDNVQGIYLDKGTSLLQTLADISAAEASIPVGGKCATLAAQVKHVAFYLEVVDNSVRDPAYPRADWDEIWRTVGQVTPEEWQAIQAELRHNYNRIRNGLAERRRNWQRDWCYCPYRLSSWRNSPGPLYPQILKTRRGGSHFNVYEQSGIPNGPETCI